ncbi:sigma-70 region 4 domain-containing protein [Streptomyces sp. ME19-01-6]|uniref:sigma-70 region 4 domain-containing protein n=1 Tax=Streptomyces sp. ME19-01-6 TaxID=3028686 RepID=UPI0029BE12CE|nr:sigma-70 region 4 domain-containing protein [Streptomyces sp. ME19-01-6]MDX3229235.1 sigma-70 region 4 domain-containing protein [Streptomyces sp. ME19-01-6]
MPADTVHDTKPSRRPRPETDGDFSDEQLPPVTLPLAFQAFHHLHYERYLEYARAHLPETKAIRAVREAFGCLATHWPYIVSRLNPTSCAWSWFTTRIRIGSCPVVTAVCPSQYDAVLLHYVLGHPIKEAAALMGEHPSRVRYLTSRYQGPSRPRPTGLKNG